MFNTMPLGQSKSTDKLAILMEGVASIPAEAFSRIKTANLTWEQFDECVVPNFTIEFYDKTEVLVHGIENEEITEGTEEEVLVEEVRS